MSAGNNYDFQQLVNLCTQTHQEMKIRAGRSVNIHLVVRNWLFGLYVVEYEQNGYDRAEYGAYLIERLSDELGKQLGRGFSARSLEQCRKFYLTHKQIPQTMSAEFGMDNEIFPANRPKKAKVVFDSQACAYYSMFVNEISQQSADQLPWFHINPVEFDGFRMQAEMFNPESEQEEEK